MEKLTVNKKKGLVKLSYYNICLSKREKVRKIEEVIDIEIIDKGIVKRGLDTSKFYIRIKFKDDYFDFGRTVNFWMIQDKYKKVIASVKEIIIPEIITRDMVRNVVKDYVESKDIIEDKLQFGYNENDSLMGKRKFN